VVAPTSAVAPVSRSLTSLNVQVPEKAVVYIGKYKTKTTGTKRRYVHETLQRGQVARYWVRAEIMRQGRKVHETKQVDLRGGAESSLVFDFKDVETSLTLKVPADAKVYLANSVKKVTGTVRVFNSKKLDVGQKVSDYPVRVSVVRNGQLISKEQTISLIAGESKTLSFRFDEQSPVAALP
jgi:uncharacterized protein (TIGR03000 family)